MIEFLFPLCPSSYLSSKLNVLTGYCDSPSVGLAKIRRHEQGSEYCFIGVPRKVFVESSRKFPAVGSSVCGL